MSQFSGAAALFRKKESEMLQRTQSPAHSRNSSPVRSGGQSFVAHSPQQRDKETLSVSHLVSPGFRKPAWGKSPSMGSNSIGLSPGVHKYRGASSNTSYLGKASGTPDRSKKKRASMTGFTGVPFGNTSPTQPDKPKVDVGSWRDKQTISFQASSPSAGKKPSVAPKFSPHYGGSYLKGKGNGNGNETGSGTGKATSKRSDFSVAPMATTPDIKVHVKIPDIDKKIRARKIAALPPKPKENVPEHIRKFREREAARQRAQHEKEHNSATKIRKIYLGWKARAAYPKLREAQREKLQRLEEERKRAILVQHSAVLIQKTFRGFMPRGRFRYLLECKRRRERNLRLILKIQKELVKMPKRTKADIKELKKEFTEKKKQLKRDLRADLQNEEDKIQAIKDTGHNMIQYLQEENAKLKEQKKAMQRDRKILEKQFNLLTEKSNEIARNFVSLQHFVAKKNESIRKYEISSQKCRHRYLPKYRAEMADRNRHCIAEYRVKTIYKARLYKIVQEIIDKSHDPEVIEEAQDALEDCQADLQALPELEIPEGLQNWIGGSGK